MKRGDCPICGAWMNYAFPAPLKDDVLESHAGEFQICRNPHCSSQGQIRDMISGATWAYAREMLTLHLFALQEVVKGHKTEVIRYMLAQRKPTQGEK